MAQFHNYDPGQVVATWGSIVFAGFAEGSFIVAERDEDAFTKSVGATGDVVRVRNRNRAGSVRFTLQMSSPTNDELSDQAALDELSGGGVASLLIKDLNGTTLLHATDAWIKKLPSTEYAKEASKREWALDCAELDMLVGG